MMSFSYTLPVNLEYGSGRIGEIGGYTAEWGKKVLLVTGKHSAKKTGLLDRVTRSLEQAGVDWVWFNQVEQNPLTTTVYRGVEILKRERCDCVLGVGGGSVMDASKAIAFSAENPGDLSPYIFGEKKGFYALPVLLAPTTAGTGSEGNCFAVLTNPETLDKKSLRSPLSYPKVSLIDPDLLKTLPPRGIAGCGFDALTHCVEAYLSQKAQPMTDLMALEGISLIARHLPALFLGKGSEEDWKAMSWASTLGGIVINHAGVGVPHSMEHPVSGLHFEVVHGQGLAALYPPFLRWISGSMPEKMGKISACFGGSGPEDCADKIEDFLKSIELNLGLKKLGTKEEEISWMVDNCFKIAAAGLANNPFPVEREDLIRLYQEAL